MNEPLEHRCGRCVTPFGKSAIRCVNEPATTTPIERADGSHAISQPKHPNVRILNSEGLERQQSV